MTPFDFFLEGPDDTSEYVDQPPPPKPNIRYGDGTEKRWTARVALLLIVVGLVVLWLVTQ